MSIITLPVFTHHMTEHCCRISPSPKENLNLKPYLAISPPAQMLAPLSCFLSPWGEGEDREVDAGPLERRVTGNSEQHLSRAAGAATPSRAQPGTHPRPLWRGLSRMYHRECSAQWWGKDREWNSANALGDGGILSPSPYGRMSCSYCPRVIGGTRSRKHLLGPLPSTLLLGTSELLRKWRGSRVTKGQGEGSTAPRGWMDVPSATIPGPGCDAL